MSTPEGPKPVKLTSVFSEFFNFNGPSNSPEHRTFTNLSRAIGLTRVISMNIRINNNVIPPAVYFGFIWDGDPEGEETRNQRNSLRRPLHDLRLILKSHQIGKETFARDQIDLEIRVNQRNDSVELNTTTVINGLISTQVVLGRLMTHISQLPTS